MPQGIVIHCVKSPLNRASAYLKLIERTVPTQLLRHLSLPEHEIHLCLSIPLTNSILISDLMNI